MTIIRNGTFSVIDRSRKVGLYQLAPRHWRDDRATGWYQFLLILQERKIGFQANLNITKSEKPECLFIEWYIVEIGTCFSEGSDDDEYKDYNGGEYSYTIRSHSERNEVITEIGGMLMHYICHNYHSETGMQKLPWGPKLIVLKSINFDSVCT